MSAPIEDRRVRRSKAALQRALVELVLERGYHGLSVDALAERADVTRATFYAHYLNKEALLEAVVDDFADRVESAFASSEVASRPAGRLEVLLEQAAASADVLRLIVRGEGDGAPLRRFTQRIEQVVADDVERRVAVAGASPRDDLGLVTRLRAAQLVAAVAWFVDHPGADAAETAAAVNHISERGWAWAAGLTPG